MTTIELKKQLIQRIYEINDIETLNALKTIIDTQSDSGKLKLSAEITNEIHESKNEIKSGSQIENEKLQQEIEKWLSEK